MQNKRLHQLNEREVNTKGQYVLYWMQQSQRTEYNHALSYAIECANARELPLVVCFALMGDYPEANARHFTFMLEGLQEVQQSLEERNMAFVLRIGAAAEVVRALAEDAALVVGDVGYLRHQRQWRRELAESLEVPFHTVEADVIVPVEVASDKEEYAARTIRKKLHKALEDYVDLPKAIGVQKSAQALSLQGESLQDIPALLKKLKIAEQPAAVSRYFKGGTAQAKYRFKRWLENSFEHYSAERNQPQHHHVSEMSPYLHFGQISPHWLLDQVRQKRGENVEDYVEELLVRRELAVNFVYYNSNYDSLQCIPDWASETLEKHKSDERKKVSTKEQLEQGETDDPYWNAAMRTMRERGYLHNHMRMYWGKQILQYTNTPQYAYQVALELNNKYFLDGRDANSYANIAWLFGKHDRGWTEREVWGKVRPMTTSGLERKIDTEAYLEKVEQLLKK